MSAKVKGGKIKIAYVYTEDKNPQLKAKVIALVSSDEKEKILEVIETLQTYKKE